jgi:hypothetical protein
VIATPRALFSKQGRGREGGAAVSTRIPDALLERLATYGNAEQLSMAETVRRLLEIGLDHAVCERS